MASVSYLQPLSWSFEHGPWNLRMKTVVILHAQLRGFMRTCAMGIALGHISIESPSKRSRSVYVFKLA